MAIEHTYIDSTEVQRLRQRVEWLERRLRLVLGCSVLMVAVLLFAGWQTASKRDLLTAKQLVIVDQNGTKRLILGSPTPDPVMHGKIQKRRSALNGLVINDGNGDERGGIGMMDDGTMSMCFDQNGRERACVYVLPNGRAGVLVNDTQGRDRISLAVEKEAPRLDFLDVQQKPILSLPSSKPSR